MGLIHKFGVARRGRVLLALTACIFTLRGAAAQEIIPPSSTAQPSVRLEAEQQRKEGDLYVADGKVEIQYKDLRLRADHVEYDTKTYQATARGHILFDADTQHLTADSAEFNVQTGTGLFEHVHGEVTMEHQPNSNMLVSPNPLTFEAQ
jgi:LPS-assembly protein